MDASSITGSTVTLTGPGGPVAASVSYDATSDTVTLTPSARLAFGTVYTARIDATVRGSDGSTLGTPYSWTFTTGAAVPPAVTHTVPAAGASSVNPAVVIAADFSRALDPATVNTSTVKVTGPGGGSVAGTVAYDSGTQEVTFTPSAALATGSYTVVLAATIAATDGATLGSAYTWSFTVPSSPTPLVVSASTPTAGAAGVGRDSTVSVVFNRDVTASTITTSSVVLKDASNNPVPATVSYDPSTRTAVLTPSALLVSGATYTVQLANTISTDDGTALSGTTSWTFTTGACPCTVFPGTLTPVSVHNPTQDGRSGSGPFSYELGMAFTVDKASQLTAIRFYKDAGETGTHTGTLWTSDGTKITSVVFSGESGSGWQEQALSAPVQLQTGVTYVVSVNANAFFVATTSGLAAAQGTGPLHTVVGPNGVFAPSAGIFPTGSYSSSNYFVDVVVR
jgi:hypothetical protein